MQSDDTQLLHLEPAKKVAVERCGKPATVYYWAGQARRAKQSAVSRAQLSADDKTALDDKKTCSVSCASAPRDGEIGSLQIQAIY